MFKGKSTFLEFAQSDEGISTNILSDRLKRLETHGIVSKETSPDNRSSLIYSLTDRGKDLLPIMVEITAWSAKHDELTNTPDEFLSAYKNDRSGLISSFRKPLDDD
tara:strand:+ start:1166 stop:1483 length:318 start_codon:yes stop_codon:yes gene_type:complete